MVRSFAPGSRSEAICPLALLARARVCVCVYKLEKVLCVWMLSCIYVWVPHIFLIPTEGIGSTGTEVASGWELPCQAGHQTPVLWKNS